MNGTDGPTLPILTTPVSNVTDNSTVPDMSNAMKLLILISAPSIFSVGVVGNALTLIGMLLGPSFRNLNLSVYFSALAVADTVCLCVQRLTRSWFEVAFDVMIDVISRPGCKILMFTHYSSSCSGSWLIVAVTLERLFVVCFPLKSKAICTRRAAFTIVALIILAALLANSYTLFLFDIYHDLTDGYLYCTQGSHNQLTTTIIDLALYSILPSIALWTANIILIFKLRDSADFRRNSTFSSSDSGSGSSSKPRTTLMLLTVSFTFLILTTPASLFYVIQSLVRIPKTDGVLFTRQVLQVLTSMNPAVNFILYCVSGPRFRHDLALICRPRCRCRCKERDPDDKCCCVSTGSSSGASVRRSHKGVYRLDGSSASVTTTPSQDIWVTPISTAFEPGIKHGETYRC